MLTIPKYQKSTDMNSPTLKQSLPPPKEKKDLRATSAPPDVSVLVASVSAASALASADRDPTPAAAPAAGRRMVVHHFSLDNQKLQWHMKNPTLLCTRAFLSVGLSGSICCRLKALMLVNGVGPCCILTRPLDTICC